MRSLIWSKKIIDDEARLKEQGQQQSLDLDTPAVEQLGTSAIVNMEGAAPPPPGPEAGTRYRKIKPVAPKATGNEEAVGSQDSEKPVQFNFDDDDEKPSED